jgi:hypothetical protein
MILKQRDNADSGLTWEEYKSMSFTFQVSITIPVLKEILNLISGIRNFIYSY